VSVAKNAEENNKEQAEKAASTKAGKPRQAQASAAEKDAEASGYRPVDVDAERAVLAAVLSSPAAFDDVISVLSPTDFGDPQCAAVWRAMLSLEASGRPIDAVTVTEELRLSRMLQRAGGEKIVLALAQTAGDTANVAAHAEIVAGKALLRRAVEAGRTIAKTAMQPSADPKEVVEVAEQAAYSIAHQNASSEFVTMAEAVPRLLDEMAKGRSKLLLGHSTGFAELDSLTGGFQGGQLVIVAARPGMGKSSFALQLARHMAETTGMLVPFLSYEMSEQELTLRMLASAMDYDMGKLRAGDLPPGSDRDVAVHLERMAAVPLLIDDNPPPSIGGVRSKLRRLTRRGQIGAIVIDYLQLMDGERRSRDASRAEEVSEVTRGLKRLASELDVPIIALSQLNRQLEQRGSKRPQLSDLRDSGSLEQDASLVLFIYRESQYNSAADPRSAELIIGKQRNGKSGVSMPLTFNGPSTKFTSNGTFFTTPMPAGDSGRGFSTNPF
jgi:replicative DNA helicase